MENQEEKVDEAALSLAMRWEKLNIEMMGENRPVLQPNQCTCEGGFDEDCYCGDYYESIIDVVVLWCNGCFTFHPNAPNNIHGLFWHIDDAVEFPVPAQIAASPIGLDEEYTSDRFIDIDDAEFIPGETLFSWKDVEHEAKASSIKLDSAILYAHRQAEASEKPCSMKETNA